MWKFQSDILLVAKNSEGVPVFRVISFGGAHSTIGGSKEFLIWLFIFCINSIGDIVLALACWIYIPPIKYCIFVFTDPNHLKSLA